MEIKVVTFNVHHGRGMDGKLDLDRIIHVLKKSEGDIIGLNEVDRNFSKRSGFIDQVSQLADRLQMNFAFGPSLTLKSGNSQLQRQYGNACLSRFPIVAEQNHVFDFYSGILEGRALLELQVSIQGHAFKIFVTHLSLNPFLHKKQTNFILQRIMNEQHPAIVMGDWNMRPQTKRWRKVTQHAKDVCLFSDKPIKTFPSLRPRTRLDYIFVSKEFQIHSVGIVDEIPAASDHLPLKAVLRFNPL